MRSIFIKVLYLAVEIDTLFSLVKSSSDGARNSILCQIGTK